MDNEMHVSSVEAINEMLNRYIYVEDRNRHCDTQTGELLDRRQFAAVNAPHVASFGSSGVRSSWAIFHNDPRARKVRTMTCSNGPLIVGDALNILALRAPRSDVDRFVYARAAMKDHYLRSHVHRKQVFTRLLLPYYVERYADGREVLFDRTHTAFCERRPGQPASLMAPSKSVCDGEEIGSEHFYNDGTPEREKLRAAMAVLEGWGMTQSVLDAAEQLHALWTRCGPGR
jgi:hypothetical protein